MKKKIIKTKKLPGPRPVWKKGDLFHGYYKELVDAAYQLERSFDGTFGQEKPPMAVRRYLAKHNLSMIPREVGSRVYQASWKARGNVDYRVPRDPASRI